MKQNNTFLPFLATIVICATFAGCYTTGGEDPGPVAIIARVEQDPATISPTDTVKFTVIISHQFQQKVGYSWSFGGKGVHLNGVKRPGDTYIGTDSHLIYWTPAGESGLLFGTVQIESLDKRYETASTSFEIKYK